MSLTQEQLKNLDTKGLYSDGVGLYLQIATNGTKSWIYRYQLAGKRREMGLGGYPQLGLAKARKLRDQHRLQVKAGIDPLALKDEAKKTAELARKQESVRRMTFSRCAEDYIAQNEAGWKNGKHKQQWENTLKTYAYPIIGDLPVEEVELDHILTILKPIWNTKTETATRIRSRIELVLDYAKTLKYRTGENPAYWRGNLAHLLPKPVKLKKVKHHKALPYDEVGEFMLKLKSIDSLSAKALQLTILCGARTSETLEATWSEFDLAKKLWTIPPHRMKAEKEHRIPLSIPAIELLSDLKNKTESEYVFNGAKVDKPLSNMAMLKVLDAMGRRGDITVHGFRSTFRDWIAEQTNFPRRVAETALAHQLKDGAEAAYQRGDLMEKRRDLMDAWARYCYPSSSNVVELKHHG